MDRIVKLNSLEGGAFDANQNRLNFQIPIGTGAVDMANTYINLVSTITCTNDLSGNVIAVGNGILPQFNVDLTYLNSATQEEQNVRVPSVAMVRTCSLSSQYYSRLEDIRRVDVLRTNLKQFTQANEDLEGELATSIGQYYTRTGVKDNVFRELHKEGTIRGSDLVAPIKIKMSDLFNLGSATLDLNALGRLDVNLELYLNRFKPQQFTTPTTIDARHFGMDAIVDAVANQDYLITETDYKRLEDSPWFVGQVVTIEAKTGDEPPVASTKPPPAYLVIKEIIMERGAGEVSEGAFMGQLKLVFDRNIVAEDADAPTDWVNILVKPAVLDSAALSFSVQYAEMVIQYTTGTMDKSQPLVYTTFTTEEDNALGLQFFQKQYQFEPTCINFFTMFPSDADDLISVNNVANYRVRLDGVDLTNRNIKYNDPLYKDRLAMSFINTSRTLKSLASKSSVGPSRNSQPPTGGDEYNKNLQDRDVIVISNPTPVTQTRKLVDFQVEAPAANVLKSIIHFKEVVKTISFRR